MVTSSPSEGARALVHALDARLRRAQGIVELDGDERCLLRVARVPAPYAVALGDGTAVARGAPTVELHLWNEHVPVLAGGGGIGWAARMRRSLRLVAAQLASDPGWRDVVAVHGAASFVTAMERGRLARMAARFGFELHDPPRSPGTGVRRLGENLLLLALIWTFNPRGLRRDSLARRRYRVWMSRARLLALYGPPEGPRAGPPRGETRDAEGVGTAHVEQRAKGDVGGGRARARA